jgi:hypothetical protein
VLQGSDALVQLEADLVAELDGEREVTRRQEARLGIGGNA